MIIFLYNFVIFRFFHNNIFTHSKRYRAIFVEMFFAGVAIPATDTATSDAMLTQISAIAIGTS